MKRTYQPSNVRRKRRFGFRRRMKTQNGRIVLNRRRRKGRRKLSASDEYWNDPPPKCLWVRGEKNYLYRVTEGMGKFSGKERVRKREDIARLMRQGTRQYSKQYSLIIVKNSLDVVRIAVSVKKKVGKAAERNYEKRLVRECFRREKDHFPKGFDLLVIVKQTTDDFDLSYRSLKSLFRRSLLWTFFLNFKKWLASAGFGSYGGSLAASSSGSSLCTRRSSPPFYPPPVFTHLPARVTRSRRSVNMVL